jgi:RNA polymerase sigma-70 factor (ECF subfamily)
MALAHPLQVWMPAQSQPIDSRIAAAARGDRAAAEALLTELLPRVRNLVRYLVRGDRDVDDIAQEALIAIARGFASYRGEGTLTAWADRIAARTTFAFLRRERREPGNDTSGPDLTVVPHPDDGPDRYAERRQLVRMLDQISDDQRHVLVLHHALGLSVPEIAESLAVSAETVRSRLRLGKAKLRALGQVDEPGDDERSGP